MLRIFPHQEGNLRPAGSVEVQEGNLRPAGSVEVRAQKNVVYRRNVMCKFAQEIVKENR